MAEKKYFIFKKVYGEKPVRIFGPFYTFKEAKSTLRHFVADSYELYEYAYEIHDFNSDFDTDYNIDDIYNLLQGDLDPKVRKRLNFIVELYELDDGGGFYDCEKNLVLELGEYNDRDFCKFDDGKCLFYIDIDED